MAATGAYAKPVLVETDWLQQHLGDPGLKIVEVDVDTTAYETGHIPGAVDWSWQTELSDQVRRDIASKDAWEKLLSNSGIENSDTIILYGDNNNWFAAFAYWILKMYGHEKVLLLNGGRKKWLAENRETTTEPANIKPSQYKAKDPDWSLRAWRDDVTQGLGSAERALVDVRSPQEFSGEILAPPGLSETAQRGGHIPGAANVPWAQAVRDDGTFKSPDELTALYQGKGVTPDKDVIAYCRIGERSSHTWFVLHELLGYPRVRNYDGSWTEWGSMVGTPIER
jgi:thiosulfate/3-mercaptopyruvate sulfurtransferase